MFRGTPNTDGRPKGAKNKMTREVREVILEAIKEGQETFMDRFGSLQNRDFVRHYIELLKLIVPTPKEVHVYDEKEDPQFKVVVVNARDEIEKLEELEKNAS